MGGNKVIDNYVLLKVIGSGQFGDVYKAKRLDTEEFFAVKTIKIDKFQNTPQLHNLTKNEVEILSKIDNPHIIKFIKMLKTTNNIYIVYELCNGGTLEELLDKKKYLKENECIDIMKQILKACQTLVQLNILHRDMKPSNILFHDNVVKLADFGFCKSLNSSTDHTETMVGSPVYMAPEILKNQPYSLKADVYSLGVVLYEMAFGIVPFEDSNIGGLLAKVKDGKIVFHNFNKLSSSMENIIKKMLDPNPTSRIDWNELFEYFLSESELKTNGKIEIKQENKIDPKIEIRQDAKVLKENISNIDSKPISTIPTLEFKFYLNNPLNSDLNKDSATTQTSTQNSIPIQIPNTNNKISAENVMSTYMLKCKVYRDKLLFLWKVFQIGSETFISEETHYIQFLVLKRMHNINHEILGLFQNRGNLFSYDEFKYIMDQVDYGKVFALINSEIMKFDDVFSSYRNYLITSVDKKKLSQEADEEIASFDHNSEKYNSRIVSYVNKLKNKIDLESSLDRYDVKRYSLHQNLLLDTIILDDIFENFMSPSLNLNNQSYLTKLNSFGANELNEFATVKLAYIKMNS